MLEIASQMILCLLLAALLGFIIGYLFGKGTCASDDCGHTAEVQHDTHAVATAATTDGSSENDKPELLSAPRNGKKDNLTRIKGVGIKIEESLNEIGIYHFDQIAAWDTENIAWADSTLGFPGRAKREEWVAQAKALDAGEDTEFSKRVDAGEVSTSKQA
jgi:NADH-quinone oxidoreductase subunit E